jgi:hypothetical protein
MNVPGRDIIAATALGLSIAGCSIDNSYRTNSVNRIMDPDTNQVITESNNGAGMEVQKYPDGTFKAKIEPKIEVPPPYPRGLYIYPGLRYRRDYYYSNQSNPFYNGRFFAPRKYRNWGPPHY